MNTYFYEAVDISIQSRLREYFSVMWFTCIANSDLNISRCTHPFWDFGYCQLFFIKCPKRRSFTSELAPPAIIWSIVSTHSISPKPLLSMPPQIQSPGTCWLSGRRQERLKGDIKCAYYSITINLNDDGVQPKISPTISFSGMYRKSFIYRRNRTNSQ